MELAEVLELVTGDEAPLRQDAVVAGGGVALAEDEPVPVGILGVLGVHAHVVKEDAGHKFHRGEGTAGVTAARVGRHIDDVAPDGLADLF